MAKKWGPSLYAQIDVCLFKNQTLGIGSYGKVCRARYGSLPCAAKLIHETLFDPEASKLIPPEKEHRLPFKRFEQECEVLHNLRHPNVIQYLGVYQDPDTKLPVLLMELMDCSLTHFLKNSSQQLPFHIHVNFCHDIALALSFLHANKVIHRDLSSNNVLLISNIRAKVTDFGMATLHVGEQGTCTLCPGTDVYMPPEAVQDKPVYAEKIDCFSLGVLIIQILTGLFPAPGSRQDEIELEHSGLLKGRKVMVSVPEVERRKNHISLIDPNQPLLAIAQDCLKDADSDRPSAQQICERVAALKKHTKYTDGIKEVDRQEVRLEALQGEKQKGEESLLHTSREMKELMDAKEKENLRLNKLIHLKDETIAALEKEIKELKKQLAAASTEKDKELPKRESQLIMIEKEASIDKLWYHGVLSYREAERRMGEMDMNTFLIRESVQDSGNLILSVKNGDKCYHFPIEKNINGMYEVQGTHMLFSSVQELVDYYMQNGLPESSGGKLIQLIKPCTFGIPHPVNSRMEHLYVSIDDVNDDSNERQVESKEEVGNDHILEVLSKVKSRQEAAPAGSHAQLPVRKKPPERPPPPCNLRSPASKVKVQLDYGRCPSIPAQKSPHGSPLQMIPVPPVLLEQCKKLMPYWHKPQLLREEAISYLLDKDPGWFVIRDSTTVTGGYALTVRMSPEEAKSRARRRLSKENPAADDMVIAHFLIQPDPGGVSLQGWNERTFKTLPEFIAHHTVEKLCLPCKLVLPVPPAQSKSNAPMKEGVQKKLEEKEAMEKSSMLGQNGGQGESTAVKEKLSTKNQVDIDSAVQYGLNKKDAAANVQVAAVRTMHEFKVVHQNCPKVCDSCKEMIWQDGLVCQTCQVTIHVDKESCKEKLSKPCNVGGDRSTF